MCAERLQSHTTACDLTGQWLKATGLETVVTFTVKILNGCLILIPDTEDIRAIKQQNQQQQMQLSDIKLGLRKLAVEYTLNYSYNINYFIFN
ncbi:endoribonuclease SymE [Proteus alimentorum]|uniref:Endoribonuclease SymE n=1 Tax=Proteus alimentorum TaxID=1973495 RepID=A0ABS0IX04_9GAMM|nr:endoribonuclease SymE [Proteus alimentorum]MBG2880564.1 endoribonuclease SymE [Proteus alimentorum]